MKATVPRIIKSEYGEITIKDPMTLSDVMSGTARALINKGATGLHCFYIDKTWILDEESQEIAWRYFKNEPIPLFYFCASPKYLKSGIPVYFTEEIRNGEYDVNNSALGWIGILGVPL